MAAEENPLLRGDQLPSLADLTQPISDITGSVFAQMMLAGFINLHKNFERLNKENQFPIPDGDTGWVAYRTHCTHF